MPRRNKAATPKWKMITQGSRCDNLCTSLSLRDFNCLLSQLSFANDLHLLALLMNCLVHIIKCQVNESCYEVRDK